MEILTPKEISKLEYHCKRRISKNERVYEEIDKLKTGEGLTISNSEWLIKTPPVNALSFVQKKAWKDRRFSVRKLADESGWAIIRKK